MVIFDEDNYLEHYGILRRSGRYPWGSGQTQASRNMTFLDMTEELRKQGLSDPQICMAFGIVNEHTGRPSTTALRAARSIAKNQQKQADILMAERLRAKGLSLEAIAERMGKPGESSIRALLAPGVKERADILTRVANMLEQEVANKTFVDVGSGVEKHVNIGDNTSGRIGISATKLNTAVAVLREKGYEVHPVKLPQIVGKNRDTTVKVLCPPGTTWGDAQRNRDKIQQIGTFSQDGGRSFAPVFPIVKINPKKVAIVYGDDGGKDADGVIYVREGVPSVSLGKARYAQVRVKVGDDHFLKGMAMYKDDMPPGVDLVFNTNKSYDPTKSATANKLAVMKPLEKDPDFPFGAVTKPIIQDYGTPKARVTSAMNVIFEEGDWKGWSKSLSAQFLSKQSPAVARAQLNETYERRKGELEKRLALTNPTVKKKLLEAFADGADTAAVHLEAAALNDKQAWHAILPINSLPPTQVYAPRYDHGERVAVVRFPHGGTFEIPDLIVNNRHPESRKLLGDAPDAIGIHPSVAKHLSGADFDGDTVIVIPNRQGKVKVSPALEKLKDFDTGIYKKYEGMKVMTKEVKGIEMGIVSNLITDMTIRGASHEELAQAVKHSMVVIDAEKHELNWKQSAIDHGIPTLKKKYQTKEGGKTGGASTLISRAGAKVFVPHRRPRYESEGGPVDKATGRKMYTPTGKTRTLPDGSIVPKLERSKMLAETEDAHALVSDANTRIEKIYADHSNKLKGLANEARLAAIRTPSLQYSDSANKVYAKEVASLDAKLTLAIMNRPLERQALVVANARVKVKRQANPNLEGDTLRKLRYQELADARTRLKADQTYIKITQEEWNAIQAGAIHNHKLSEILAKADIELVTELASPSVPRLMTEARTARAQSMLDLGYTRAEVAKQLGVSLTTLDTSIKGP